MATNKDLLLGSELNQAENGCQLDLRAKFAITFLNNLCTMEGFDIDRDPGEYVGFAYDLAIAFVETGRARGLIIPLSEDDEPNAAMKRLIRKNIRAQLYQNTTGQKMSQEIQGSQLVRAAPMNGNSGESLA